MAAGDQQTDTATWAFLKGGGDLGERIRAHDWSQTPLGPPLQWPQSLKTALQIMLSSGQPTWVGWGADLTYFYNDPYKSIIADRHPAALGRPTREVWAELWEYISPLLDQVTIAGEGVYVESQFLLMERSGYPEETYFTFSYSPVPGEDGKPGGVICFNTEDTKRVVGERQLALLSDLGARIADARTRVETGLAVEQALGSNPRDIGFALLYMADAERGGLTLTAASQIAGGSACAPAHIALDTLLWPIGSALSAREAIVIDDAAQRLGANAPAGVEGVAIKTAVLLPVVGDQGRGGVLIVGLNPLRLFDDGYQRFLNLVAGQISAAFVSAEAYEMERRRAEALAELDRTKTAFFSNVSHEFRTPITLLLGPLEEMLAQDTLPAASLGLVEAAHRNGVRLMKLVNTLLDFSRIEAGRVKTHFRPTDLGAFTADLASSFRSATERAGLALRVDTPPLSRLIDIDQEMWEKIVLNLLSNAFKFTFDGEIAITLREIGDMAQLTVRDTGIGIAEGDLARIFERFHRIEGARGRTFEGSGIGLALVHELVNLHGGDVTVASEPGAGSTFTIAIPMQSDIRVQETATVLAAVPARAAGFVEEALRWIPEDNASAPPERELRAWPVGSGRPRDERLKILFADDNADMRDYVRRLLEPRFDIETVPDGEAALAQIRRARPDLLLTDVMMPRLNGFELLRIIRDDPALQDLAVVMLSARAGEEARVDGIEAGADDYLVKPFSARELIARVSTNVELAVVRRQAEAALREVNTQLTRQSERLSQMFEQAPTFMAVVRGPDHVFELANPEYLAMTGRSDIIGKPMHEALPEVAEQGYIAVLDEVYRTGKPFVAERVAVNLARTADAPLDRRHLDFVYQPMTDHLGQISGIFVQGTDVTERVDVEADLARQNLVLERLYQTGTAIAGELELQRVVQMVTDAGVDLSGASFGAFFYNHTNTDGEAYMLYTLSGAPPEDFAHLPMPRITALFEPTFGGGPVIRSDDILNDPRYGQNPPYKGMPPDHLPVRSYLTLPVVSRSGEVIGALFFGHVEPGRFTYAHEQMAVAIASQAAIAIDNARLFDAAQREINQRSVAQAALRDLNASLEERIAAAVAEREEVEEVLRQAQKMEAVGQLTGGIAHDFNNLLTVITGNMDMALRMLGDEDANHRLRRAIGNALKGADRAAGLTQRLLAFSRRQPLAPQPLDADRLIAGMSELLKRTLGETVQLETVTAPGLWRVEADTNQLESALLNLAVNARDAMPGGGKLTIETANAWLDQAYADAIAEVAPGSYVVIAVSDTGSGMPRDVVARVFEPFFTTKEVGKGTGLGLSMVYGFVKQSGGHVKVYSEEGEGTTVKIYLPRLVGEVVLADDEAAIADPHDGHGETIFVVEDDDDVRVYTVEILRELGYSVLEAPDGPTALRTIERADIAIDLLLTDVVMPMMSGRELAEAAHLIRPQLKVLYTSGYTRNAIVHGGRLDPGVEMIPKPFTYQALSEKVRDVLDSGRSGRLLLVEGDPRVRVLSAEALMRAGHAIDEAANAAEALGKVRASGGGYDAVLLDLDLPDGRAIGLARELRAMHADLAILLLSGAQDLPDPSLADDRCTDWIRKPYRIDDVREALARLGRHRRDG
ncbi:response regulator [Novosphingobium sp.]|uniref:response regulator n=1 Tax=Novosphingobium sp. TaxID=1874826 RepID=UPI003B524516